MAVDFKRDESQKNRNSEKSTHFRLHSFSHQRDSKVHHQSLYCPIRVCQCSSRSSAMWGTRCVAQHARMWRWPVRHTMFVIRIRSPIKKKIDIIICIYQFFFYIGLFKPKNVQFSYMLREACATHCGLLGLQQARLSSSYCALNMASHVSGAIFIADLDIAHLGTTFQSTCEVLTLACSELTWEHHTPLVVCCV